MSAELPVISLVPHPVNATSVAKDTWTRLSIMVGVSPARSSTSYPGPGDVQGAAPHRR